MRFNCNSTYTVNPLAIHVQAGFLLAVLKRNRLKSNGILTFHLHYNMVMYLLGNRNFQIEYL